MRVVCVLFDKNVPTSKIAEHFLRFSPQICIKKEEAIFIEIGKSHKLYSEDTFFLRTLVILRRLNLRAKIQIGTDVTDSYTLAKYSVQKINDLPLLALIDFCDPFARDEFVRKQVSELVNNFKSLGINTIGDFKKIPISQLISRFGLIGRLCYQRVQMHEPIGWPNWKPEEKILEHKQFPYFEFYGELEPITFELKTMLDSIYARLRARAKSLTKLRMNIVCERSSAEPNPVKTFNFEFYSPQAQTKGTIKVVKERLSRYFEKNPIKSPIESMSLEVISTVDFSGAQKNIFNNEEEKQEKIFSLHAQLIEILGKDNVYQAQLTEDRRPEKSWIKSFSNPHVKSDAVRADISQHLPERATFLLKYPQRISITNNHVYIKNKRYEILKWDKDDIEKITGGWFEKPDERIKNGFDRQYYILEIENHQRISVFKSAEDYFMHGYFG